MEDICVSFIVKELYQNEHSVDSQYQCLQIFSYDTKETGYDGK